MNKSEVIYCRIEPKLKEEITRKAKSLRLSVSEYLIRLHLESKKEKH